MKILQINNHYNQPFCAKKELYYISKKEMLGLVPEKASFEPKQQRVRNAAKKMAATALAAAGTYSVLQLSDVTYCNAKDGLLNVAIGYNGGFYNIKSDFSGSSDEIKRSFVNSLNLAPYLYGGLINYIDMVKDIKRQDILEKGLQLHTCTLNNSITTEQKYDAAAYLSNRIKKDIDLKDLFFIDDEAFYYDKDKKTAYSVNATSKVFIEIPPSFRVCKFETDQQGNAIGYKVSMMDLFQHKPVEHEYIEQQTLTEELPTIADSANNKLFAEAFRFGNMATPNVKQARGAENVLNHLLHRVRVKNPSKDKLQFVRFYDKEKNVLYRICYYDSTTGRSFIYNEDGKYMYQMEYNKDAFGIIRACTKF